MELFRHYKFDNMDTYTYIGTSKELKKEAYKIISDNINIHLKETHENCQDLGDWVRVERYQWKSPADNVELTIYYNDSDDIVNMTMYDSITDEHFSYIVLDD